jgi:aryl-alcohol dehydrogenase-like predicted oxidoreductase
MVDRGTPPGMDKKRLGPTEFEITRLGLGAWAIGGGDWAFGWGPQDDKDSLATIHHAVELGLNWIDTAAVYGFGKSEEIIGQALKKIDKRRRPYVFTKCSLLETPDRTPLHSLKAESIRKECDASLTRLGVEVIDLYQIHWPSRGGDQTAPDIEEGWSTLVELKKAGKVRHIGVSNFDKPQLERIQKIHPVASLQPPYSAIARDVEHEILPYCLAQNIGVINYSPMQSGLLTGKMTRERIAALPAEDWRRKSAQFNEPRLSKNLVLVEAMKAVASRHKRSPGEIAIAWTLRHPAITAAIVGARRPEQLDELIAAADIILSDVDLQAINKALPDKPSP